MPSPARQSAEQLIAQIFRYEAECASYAYALGVSLSELSLPKRYRDELRTRTLVERVNSASVEELDRWVERVLTAKIRGLSFDAQLLAHIDQSRQNAGTNSPILRAGKRAQPRAQGAGVDRLMSK